MLATVGQAGERATDLTVASWGGAYAESQRQAYGASFEAKTGRRILWEEYGGGLAEVRAQVAAGAPVWDVVDVFAHDARSGCAEGLFETLPPAFYAALDDDLLVNRPNDCVAPNILWSWVTAYAEDRFGDDPPRELADFFDLARFPGPRAIGAFPQANLEMALVADGVTPDQVYEVLDTEAGVERAFRKLSTIAEGLVFWTAGEEPVELLQAGTVAMSTAYNGRIGAAVLGEGARLGTIWDGQVLEEEWFVIVVGAPNREAALDFLAHAAAPEQQAAQARWITYGPMRASAHAIIAANEPWFVTGDPVLPHLPSTTVRLNRSIRADSDWWTANGAEMTERFALWRRSLGF